MGKSGHRIFCAQRAIRLLLVLGFAYPAVLCADGPVATADAERMRRLAGVEEAEMLLEKGDEAYGKGNFSDAAEAYAGARDLLPDAPLTAELRRAATDRYAQASVEHGRALVRKGDLAAAGAIVDRVLQKDAAPNDPGALAFRAQLDDPIRTNPALNAEHARNIDQVRRLLYTAEGAYELGKFDEARKHYESILRIDPTNTAARRGMERVTREIQSYARTAQGHTRAEMLAEVDKQWETALTPTLDDVPGGLDRGVPGESGQSDVLTLLNQVRIEQVMLNQVSLSEAVDYLRSVSKAPGPVPQVINYNLNLGPDDSETAARIRAMKFDLQLNDVPLLHVLRVITDMTQTTFTTDAYSVLIRPRGSDSGELIERTFRVPPDFLTSVAVGGGAAPQSNDPFADNAASGPGLLTQRMSAQDAFARQGVGFPEGAYANYNQSTTTLRVRNTSDNLDIIQQIVDSVANTEPVMVAVRVTMITTLRHNLEELGFDWLLSPVPLGDDVFAAGGTVGSSPGRTGADFTSPINGAQVPGVPLTPTALVTSGLLTNGLRSGDYQTTGSSLSELLADPTRAGQQSKVAPGILSMTGLFTDGQVQLIMRGLSQKKGVDIMARPSTITRSGQQSTVEIIQEFYYPTEYEPPEVPTSAGNTGGAAPVTPAMPTSFEMRPVGVELQVLPTADAEKRYVDLTLQPSFSKFDGFVNYGSPITSAVPNLLGGVTTTEITENAILMPVFSVQQTNTQLTIADGATVVFGGLMADRIQKGEDKVPVLGQLPLLGKLFTSTSSQPISTAIIFMVQVELIDPTGRPYRDR